MTLSTRAEQAKPEEARGLLEELFLLRVGDMALEGRAAAQFGFTFRQFLLIGTAEAHLAAAMMLMPEGWGWALMPHYADLRHPERRVKDCVCHGATPALALIAAISKAIGDGK